MLVQVEVEAVGPGVHQRLQPLRTGGVLRLHAVGVDEELHPQVAVDRGLALGLRQAAHRVDVVRLDAIEVVLGLRVDHPEDRVGVGLAVDVRDAPVVADDGDVLGLLLPACDVGFRGGLERAGDGTCDQQESDLLHSDLAVMMVRTRRP